MIYVTGDTHGSIDIRKLSMKQFPEQKELTRDDYVIVCGDFGLFWQDSSSELYWRKWLSGRNFTTLWIDGNHENFDYLKDVPLMDMFGGKVRKMAPHIYHLDRGQVLTIDGKKFFIMGGATSHDKWMRTENVSWWKEELPSREELERGLDALDANNWTVDYVLTHCAPKEIQSQIADWYENDELTGYLERIRTDLTFKKWFFGHYHTDREIDGKYVAVYEKILQVE